MSTSFLLTTFLAMAAGLGLLGSALVQLRARLASVREELAGSRTDLVRQFRESEFFRVASENANDGIVILTLDGKIQWCNSAYLRMLGRTREEVMGRNPLEFALPEEDTPSMEEIRNFRFNPRDPNHKSVEIYRNRRGDGSLFWTQLSISFRKTAKEAEYAIIVCRDISDQIEKEEALTEAHARMERQARQDELTGLMNRRAFMEEFEALLSDPSSDRLVGLMHLDLDKFKEVNDTHGHAAGDATLIHISSILRTDTPPGTIISRFGGDEFLILVPDVASLDALHGLARALITRVTKVFGWQDRLLKVGASFGVAVGRPGEATAETLLTQSDFALYEAKRDGRGMAVKFDEEMASRQTSQVRRAEELYDAIDTGSLDHHFQPVADNDGKTILGFEALVRWDHPEEGLLTPDAFLPLAKELGLMGELDLSSMARALRRKQALDAAGFPGTRVGFNASPELLNHPEFLPTLIRAVEIGQIDRSRIVIEVLETTAFGDLTDAASSAAAIRDLRHAGFQIHLDDFGTGYAGLAHLASLAVTGIKIDRTLISTIFKQKASAKIVQKIIELGRDLGLEVIAEGVEDKQTAYWLSRVGCTAIQGFWINPPLAEDEVVPWLEARSPGNTPLQLVAR